MDVATTDTQSYGRCEAAFFAHYQQHRAEHSGTYDQYRPAYRYGYDLGVHARYGAGIWLHIESEARALWEARNPGTWEQFKVSIHYAWATASGTHLCSAS